jgi:amino acid transporter
LAAAVSEFWVRAIVIALLLALLTWINIVGVRAGARTAVVFVLAKTSPRLPPAVKLGWRL